MWNFAHVFREIDKTSLVLALKYSNRKGFIFFFHIYINYCLVLDFEIFFGLFTLKNNNSMNPLKRREEEAC